MQAGHESDIVLPEILFELTRFEHSELFGQGTYAWEALLGLKEYITRELAQASPSPSAHVMEGAIVGQDVIFGENVTVEPHAYIKGPAIIGAGTEIRHGAYVRDHVVIGRNCVIGNATEVKHSILMDGARASHWNYVGDSILGSGVKLGAGTKLSNKKITSTNVSICDLDGKQYSTGLQKLGAIIGDGTHIGCNAVLNPGTLLGKRCLIYALVSARGTHPHERIIKE